MRVSLLVVVLLLAGCAKPSTDAPPAAADTVTDAAGEAVLFANLTGRVTGTPADDGAEDLPFEVPQGAVAIEATLSWTAAVADLDMALVDPDGKVVDTCAKEDDTHCSLATLDPPASGTWNVRVSSMRALDEPFTVATRVLLLEPLDNVLEQTYQIGGTDASAFKEVNFIMAEDATFAYSFTATAPVHFDIHSHEDGETSYHEREVSTGKEGTFTAEHRHIYSVLFSVPDDGTAPPVPATVEFRMEGAFRLHSHVQ